MTIHNQPEYEFDIVQLIYCGRSTKIENKPEFKRDLDDILDRSQAYNSLHDITGALTTDGSMFAHVVEGTPTAVKDLYAKIMRDKRHDRVLTLQYVLVHVRLFDRWPIAFAKVGALPHVRTLEARSTPAERRKASVSVLQAFRPLLLR